MYPGIKLPVVLGSDGVGYIDDRRVILNPGLDWGSSQAVQSADFHVLGMPSDGTLQEQIVVPATQVYDAPDHLSDEEAAALPLAGVTAYRALVTKCRPMIGEKVLITGIGGGVALFALQYAVAIGCEVYVTSSSQDKIDQAVDLGAADGALYTDDNWARQIRDLSNGIDVAIDSAGGAGFAEIPGICNPGARIAFYGGTRGKIHGLNPQVLFWRQISIFGSTMGSDRDFVDMLDFVNRHDIIPVVDSIYDLKDVDQAFDRMARGDQFGKIVLSV
jgi:NADPH:quinone reductase-like Zn-dependent oxidoreductase